MPTCTRKGCGKEFDLEKNEEGDCHFHPGGPIFHEGLKSWSCCKDVNKPVLTFDEFMAIPGCETGKHTQQVPESSPPPAVVKAAAAPKITTSVDGKEVYTSSAASPILGPTVVPAPAPKEPAKPVPIEIEEDEPDAKVEQGMKCKRNGCGVVYEDDETHRTEGGKEATCVFHPAPPIFHEGSKGYMCCKRRVLEFDEFLKIQGCTTGKHLFVGKPKAAEEELVQCRIDHYQTPQTVQVSVFAKKADKEKSTVVIGEDSVDLDLFLPDHKRFTKTIKLFGPIKAEESSSTILGTKVELKLVKVDARSWNMLETPREGTPVPEGFNLTFGVGGRTGSIGAKEVILDAGNKLKLAASGVKA